MLKSPFNPTQDLNFCVDIVNLERLISISNVVTFTLRIIVWSLNKIFPCRVYPLHFGNEIKPVISRFSATKELSLCQKLCFSTPYIFGFQCRTSLIFLTYIVWSNRIHSLKYLRSTTLKSKDIRCRKAEFVAKTQFLLNI